MVKEWTGAWVHISEFEPKQPQLEPHPIGADPQGLMHARPARVEFPVQDILPNDPFTTTAASGTLSVSYPSNQINDGTSYVRFQSVKKPVGGVAISTLQLENTLNGNISDSVTTITLTDATEFPTSGFIMIEKIDTTPDTTNYGKYLNEVIQYTDKSGTTSSSKVYKYWKTENNYDYYETNIYDKTMVLMGFYLIITAQRKTKKKSGLDKWAQCGLESFFSPCSFFL